MIYIWLYAFGMGAAITMFKLDQTLNLPQIVALMTGATILGYIHGEYKEKS